MKYRTLANVGLWVWREAEQGWQEHGCVSVPRNVASSHLCKGRRSTVMLTTVTRGESWSCCSWCSQRDTSKCFTYNSDQRPHDRTALQSSKPDYKISFQFGLKWICRIGTSDVKWKWIPQISIYFIGKHYWFFYRLTLFFSSSPLPTPTFSRIECFDLREAVQRKRPSRWRIRGWLAPYILAVRLQRRAYPSPAHTAFTIRLYPSSW